MSRDEFGRIVSNHLFQIFNVNEPLIYINNCLTSTTIESAAINNIKNEKRKAGIVTIFASHSRLLYHGLALIDHGSYYSLTCPLFKSDAVFNYFYGR